MDSPAFRDSDVIKEAPGLLLLAKLLITLTTSSLEKGSKSDAAVGNVLLSSASR